MSSRGGGLHQINEVIQKRWGGLARFSDGVGQIVAQIKSEPVEWLWPGRIPLGKITALDGDPGLGKSLLALDLASRLSQGKAMPQADSGRQGGAVLVSVEDSPADTIRPRLEAAGADLNAISVLNTVPEGQGSRPIELPKDIGYLRQEIERVGARLVVIDPLSAVLGPEVNMHRDHDVRRALAPLAALADEMHVAIVVVRHLNKGSGERAIYRGGGSIGIIGAARAGLVVAADPEDPDLRLLAATKSNLGPPAETLRFRIKPLEAGRAQIEWLGTSQLSADTILSAVSSPERRARLDEACEFLRQALAEGPLPAAEVQRLAGEAGHAPKTIERARKRVKVVVERDGFGSGSQSVWSVPGNAGPHTSPNDPIDRQPQDLAMYGELGEVRDPETSPAGTREGPA